MRSLLMNLEKWRQVKVYRHFSAGKFSVPGIKNAKSVDAARTIKGGVSVKSVKNPFIFIYAQSTL